MSERADGYRRGYEAARSYYSTRSTRTEKVLAAWSQPGVTKDRGREVIAQAWPELFDSLNELRDWE